MESLSVPSNPSPESTSSRSASTPPFTSPDRGPCGNLFTRHGAAPFWIFNFVLLLCTGAAILATLRWDTLWAPVAVVFGLAWVFVLSFFRNPQRTPPSDPQQVASPADGTIIEVQRLENEEYLGQPCTRISIFLSVFNVHVNRSPVAGVVEHLDYRRGTFKNAMRKDARDSNECQALGLRMADGTPVLLRQIAGLIARRIVCPVAIGDRFDQGYDYGMIRFGSQTEISVPDRRGQPFRVAVKAGDKVSGGQSVIGSWKS